MHIIICSEHALECVGIHTVLVETAAGWCSGSVQTLLLQKASHNFHYDHQLPASTQHAAWRAIFTLAQHAVIVSQLVNSSHRIFKLFAYFLVIFKIVSSSNDIHPNTAYHTWTITALQLLSK